MTGAQPLRFVCHGCGTNVDPASAFPFACPGAGAGDDIDHVLVAPPPEADFEQYESEVSRPLTRRPVARRETGVPPDALSADTLSLRERGDVAPPSIPSPSGGRWREAPDEGAPDQGPPPAPTPRHPDIGAEDNPFLRYRRWLSPYRLARSRGLSDGAWHDVVGELDEALASIDGRGFRRTPFSHEPGLAAALGVAGPLWIKDETGAVSGSHKARHLMGVMAYLRVLEIARSPLAQNLRARRLAIASCGAAALAAAVVARAADWPLDVFIPADAERSVVARLRDLGATVQICERRPRETGDPCVHAARRAVARGAIPFGVQGPDNGAAIEGARTLAFEMAETLAAEGADIETLYVQVGGGALASALAQGFAIAAAAGLISRAPRLIAVQSAGCAPLARAWTRLEGVALDKAARSRSRFMQPWDKAPASLAHGILDDETYDWFEVVKAMRDSEGEVVVADEKAIERAFGRARQHTGVRASATGAAGLAGLLVRPAAGALAAVLSGIDRGDG
ncbi:threonine dehydratase [Roseiarcus fermentans]|uniref:Threonine dehydratase n=1 Tax=Roseiarcus fermentans TaxID=1473586 RepID=A0A366EUS0_9HYPH|nr:pyridoxal-phosphate dependent enzyme [Roseiarcus fermentans]RBP05676.1 threonine dehydratase [Roseiarcus fermentans]